MNLYSVAHFEEPSFYLLMKCLRLEYLSIKGVKVVTDPDWDILATHEPNWTINEPLAQDIIVEVARRHPALRWLRSDQSAENVEMLKQEWPEITFVSD